MVPTGGVSYVAGLDDSLDEVPDSQISTEEYECVMEVECGDGEEDGVKTKTDREEVRNGIVSRVNDCEVPSPLLPPSSLPSHPSQEGVDVPNSQDAVTFIDADKSSQSMVESLGEEEEKVRVERRERGWGRRGWKGVGH